eukprot:m.111903 g.111903  ORF g.111903 m.111903 type:complete len:645 (-) comp9099_c0_seq3:778-2712(-)
MAGTSEFAVAIVINAVILIVFVLIYSILKRRFEKIYFPRRILNKDTVFPRLSQSFFGWILDALRWDDDSVYAVAGLDALLYTSFFRLGLYVFSACSIFGIIVLIPVNYYGDACNKEANATGCVPYDGLDSISLTNIRSTDDRLWAHWLSAYIFVGIALYFIDRFYTHFISYRMRYFSEGREHMHTVLVRDIPRDAASVENVTRVFREIYGDEVIEVDIIQNCTKLRRFIAARDQAQAQLDHVVAVKAGLKPGKKPPHTRLGGYVCCGGTLVESEQHLREKIHNLDVAIANKQSRLKKRPEKNCTSAFVTFRRVSTAVSAAQTLMSSTPMTWTVTAAPEPRDVHWDNCKMAFHNRSIRTTLFNIATFALVLFWIIPVAFVASLTTLEALSASLPFLEPIVNANAVFKAFLQGFLPTLALLIFMALLPTILTAFSSAQGLPSISEINFSMMTKYYWFQVVNVFFVSLIAGSAFNAISDIISSPFSVFSLLSEAIPKTGAFFVNYIMLQAFGSHTGDLARLVPLILHKIKWKLLAKSEAEKAATWNPGSYNYGESFPGECCGNHGSWQPLGIRIIVESFLAQFQREWIFISCIRCIGERAILADDSKDPRCADRSDVRKCRTTDPAIRRRLLLDGLHRLSYQPGLCV